MSVQSDGSFIDNYTKTGLELAEVAVQFSVCKNQLHASCREGTKLKSMWGATRNLSQLTP